MTSRENGNPAKRGLVSRSHLQHRLSDSRKLQGQASQWTSRLALRQYMALRHPATNNIQLYVVSCTWCYPFLTPFCDVTQALDGTSQFLNGTTEWLIGNTLLFFQDNLDPNSTHVLTVQNGGGAFAFNYVQLWQFQNYTGSSESASSSGSLSSLAPNSTTSSSAKG